MGLGKFTSLHLAKQGSKVIMGCRNMQKCSAAVDFIKGENADADVVPMQVDLGSLKSVERFAADVNSNFDRLDHVGTK